MDGTEVENKTGYHRCSDQLAKRGTDCLEVIACGLHMQELKMHPGTEQVRAHIEEKEIHEVGHEDD